jgi:hypothetical protein
VCCEWIQQVNLHLIVQVRQQTPQFRAAKVDEFELTHLATPSMIEEEACRMRNCIQGWGHDITYSGVELWSIRKDGRSLATVSVGKSHGDGLASITEIKAADNKQVDRNVALVARRWLQMHDIASMQFTQVEEQERDCEKAWKFLFKPYWIEKRAAQRWPELRPKWYGLPSPWLVKNAQW